VNAMRILVTNDDGIHAPGLGVAEKIARTLSDDVWVVAPENEQSGASHSLTLSLPLRLREIDSRRFAVTGTPTDCVMMGTAYIMKDKPPTLVLSGVNRGSNLADDVTYSGTIAGAMEGCALGIPSIAMSQSYFSETEGETPWACAEAHGPSVVKRLVEIGWPKDVLINLNFPDCAARDVICKQHHWIGGSTRGAGPISGSVSSVCAPIRRPEPTFAPSTKSESR
jgi:5'-nucleotidase